MVSSLTDTNISLYVLNANVPRMTYACILQVGG